MIKNWLDTSLFNDSIHRNTCAVCVYSIIVIHTSVFAQGFIITHRCNKECFNRNAFIPSGLYMDYIQNDIKIGGIKL